MRPDGTIIPALLPRIYTLTILVQSNKINLTDNNKIVYPCDRKPKMKPIFLMLFFLSSSNFALGESLKPGMLFLTKANIVYKVVSVGGGHIRGYSLEEAMAGTKKAERFSTGEISQEVTMVAGSTFKKGESYLGRSGLTYTYLAQFKNRKIAVIKDHRATLSPMKKLYNIIDGNKLSPTYAPNQPTVGTSCQKLGARMNGESLKSFFSLNSGLIF